MVGLDDPSATVHQSSAGWVPVYVDQGRRLGVMSIGFLLKDRGDSVVWRGPKKDGMIRQFLSEVRWGDLDYLVIDTPPGMLLYLNAYQESIADMSRNIRRAYLPPHTSSPTIHPFLIPPHNTLFHPHHHSPNNCSERYDEVPLIYPQAQPPRHRISRKYGWLRLPMLWRDKRCFWTRWRRGYG